MSAANLCTLVRVLLAPLFAWQLAAAGRSPSVTPLAIYAVAVLTDLADGRLARAGGRTSPVGRLFDHGADALFLFPALAGLATRGRVPILLPCAATLAFLLYCRDGWQRGRSLRAMDLTPSRSGMAAGVANYAVVGAASGALWLGGGVLDRAVYAGALAAVALNLAAALERTYRLLQSVQRSALSHGEWGRARHR